MAGARDSERGFTLIELVVVVGVIALLALLATPALGSLTGANAREAAGRLAGGMRYLFDTAALRHSTCRMVLDLPGHAWWAECAPGAAATLGEGHGATEEDLAKRFPEEKDAQIRKLLASTRFGGFSDQLVSRRELPGNAKFGKIRLEGLRDNAESGLAYVYFFPGGRAQRAVVPIVDGDNIFTVVVEPFTGRARVSPGEVEVRD